MGGCSFKGLLWKEGHLKDFYKLKTFLKDFYNHKDL